jgi:hypothetical protein
MMGVQSISDAAPFAWNWLSGRFGIELDIDLRMSGVQLGAALLK